MHKQLASLVISLFSILLGTAAQSEPYLNAEDASFNTKNVNTRINWLTSLDQAKQSAHQNHKPILWIHMLGNMDGFA